MTLAARLSVFVLAMLGIVLFGFSLTLYLLSGRYLHRQVDERLDGTLSALSGAAEQTRHGLEWEPTQRLAGVGASPFGLPVLWFVEGHGQIVDRSPQPETDQLLIGSPADPGTVHQSAGTLEWRSGPWQLRQCRIRAEGDAPPPAKPGKPLAKSGKPPAKPGKKVKSHRELRITVATSLDPVHAALSRLAITLAGLSAGILLLALVAVRIVCRGVLAPVSRMAVAASQIGAEDLERRLPTIATEDELGQLNRAFNGVLDRLQESFERQRRFTVEASHQLRTPLAGILGQIEVALRRERPIEEYERVLSTVHKRGNHLSKIVESLLFLARANGEAAPNTFETICLNSWMPQLEAWSDNQRAADIVLQCDDAEPCFVFAHAALLGELLNILVDNARKYSPPGTPIEIRLDRDQDAALVEVVDHGLGIAEADLPHLFTPFFRSEDARRQGIEGTGLGLSIARRLAELFGARLTVTSQLGSGSRFSLRMPLADRAPADACMPTVRV